MSDTESAPRRTRASRTGESDRPASRKSPTSSKSAAGGTSSTRETSRPSRQEPSSGASGRGTAKPRAVAAEAVRALQEMTGREAESVVGLKRTGDGWQVQLEVVESRRIPDSADLLALYEVDTDPAGEMTGYRRRRRYNRGHTGEEQ
ncbi:gas vesicle protein GvpO [Isoptericola cucumis]|uniref:Gas vesicle protein GvpO n=1 Tax=Isoptericola cucumis TaxID=1776856 RepID=A0ABQ2B6E0_9MICO|nr:gas vesicle protein GvpO [Isoptericola cucumis]GGI06750.1 hypothetical protein GCM10007368_12720 [Isoptericola cucumis]